MINACISNLGKTRALHPADRLKGVFICLAGARQIDSRGTAMLIDLADDPEAWRRLMRSPCLA